MVQSTLSVTAAIFWESALACLVARGTCIEEVHLHRVLQRRKPSGARAPSSRPFSDEPFSLGERSARQTTCAAALLVRTVHHSHIVPCTMQSRSNYPQSHTGQCTHTAQRRTEPMRFLAFLCPGLTRARYQVWSLAARWAQATARRGLHCCCNRLQLGPRMGHE